MPDYNKETNADARAQRAHSLRLARSRPTGE